MIIIESKWNESMHFVEMILQNDFVKNVSYGFLNDIIVRSKKFKNY